LADPRVIFDEMPGDEPIVEVLRDRFELAEVNRSEVVPGRAGGGTGALEAMS
jgi:hypothetical protein